MKKSLKHLVAVAASVVSTGAMASNLENPLYMPLEGDFYSKTGIGIMYKETDHTAALVAKGADGKTEFPVWRFTEDFGYGITDRLDIHARLGYTKDGDINRKGMHRGRIGMTYRAMTQDDTFVLDLYADAYLSGAMPMKGTYKTNGFTYKNYSNGRWGVIGGARFGKTWDDFTLAAHVEMLQTFGNHNNKIKIEHPALLANGFADEISVDLKSTREVTAGLDTLYQFNAVWSSGFGFEYVQHSDNGVKGIHTDMPNLTAMGKGIANTLVNTLDDMDDGWDEFILKANVSYQMTDAIQLTLFGEYTFDDSHIQSQNGTDVKMELGVRMNARF